MGDGAPEPVAGREIGGRYVLEAPLGKGGMAEVWRARHSALRSHVAIKFLHANLAHREGSRKRFTAEAQITAQLKTPNAVQVFDFGITDDGQPYLVMELLEGETLGARLRQRGPLSPRRPCASWDRWRRRSSGRTRSGSFTAISSRRTSSSPWTKTGPSTSRCSTSASPSSFVSSKRSPCPPIVDDAAVASASLTRTGAMLGTPCYMAPEQIVAAPELDLRADVWAFGVVAFECLTGELPFVGRNLVDLFANIHVGKHLSACSLNSLLPAAFEVWFERACAVDPAARFQSARAAATELAVALGDDTAPMSMPAPESSLPGRKLSMITPDSARRALEQSPRDAEAPTRVTTASPGDRVSMRPTTLTPTGDGDPVAPSEPIAPIAPMSRQRPAIAGRMPQLATIAIVIAAAIGTYGVLGKLKPSEEASVALPPARWSTPRPLAPPRARGCGLPPPALTRRSPRRSR